MEKDESSSFYPVFVSHGTLSLHREAQEFVDKFEGALGKGKGRKWYAYKVMMTKVGHKISLVSPFSAFCVCVSCLSFFNFPSFFFFVSEMDQVSTGF